MRQDIYLPQEAKILERIQETPTVFTWHLQFTDAQIQRQFKFHPGQFNMVYLYGIGEVAISVASDPDEPNYFSHTIRNVGSVTQGLAKLQKGDHVGIRGPFGRSWPLKESMGKDILVISGGLGCAPTVAVINYVLQRQQQFGVLKILQGIKHSDDFIYRQRYAEWQKQNNVEVYIAADKAGPQWPWHVGHITDLLSNIKINCEKTIVMMCGPQGMMRVVIQQLIQMSLAEKNIYLSMERNMECAIGHCGHCQYGGLFICKDGPVFSYPEIKALFDIPGF